MNLRKHSLSAIMALLSLITFHVAIGMTYTEIEKHDDHIQFVNTARNSAPEVVDILVRSVDQRRQNGTMWFLAEAEVLNVIRTHRGIKVGDMISIEYTDISASARRHNQNIERNKIPGPGLKPELYLPKAADETRAYLKPSPDTPHLLTLAAGTASFYGISAEQATDPCTDHPKGPFTSQSMKCAAFELQSAKDRLEEAVKGINEFLDSSMVINDGGDIEGKQRRALAASSSAWETYRNNTCQLVYLQYFGGSMARLYELDCMTQLTEERIKLLERIYSDWVDQ